MTVIGGIEIPLEDLTAPVFGSDLCGQDPVAEGALDRRRFVVEQQIRDKFFCDGWMQIRVLPAVQCVTGTLPKILLFDCHRRLRKEVGKVLGVLWVEWQITARRVIRRKSH